ncbi:MAG: response regulator [Candidatus Eisenbacteria bacterium]|uniref:Response regulator n=1 Tax=Eiseniibacteriota bacterium TaxID=2212470 RepID=A0A937X970_UNCEI|nr:response regulator [Candidatus Eisenbacteria bacterium]
MSDAMQIPLLERALGGLMPGHAYLFHGGGGVGKTVLALQVARAWTGGGRRVLFLTADLPESLLDQSSLLGLSLQPAWERGDLVLCAYAHGAAADVRAHGMRAFLERLRAAGGEQASALILDPITPLFEAFGGAAAIERDVRLLCDTLRDWRWSVAFLADTNELRQRSGLREALAARCAGVLELSPARGRPNPAESPFILKVERARQVTPAGGLVPYAIVLEAGLIPVSTPSEEESFADARADRPARVLLGVGEESEEIPALARLLRRTMEVEVVADGATALARAATWNPDVLLLQADLKPLSGYAVCRALRQGRYTVPVILMTGKGRRRSDRVRALLNGATDLVQTPFDLREVAGRIRMASRMRVASLETGVELHLLEVLSARARDNLLELPEFLEGVGVALRAAGRFSSPVSLVTFRFHADPAAPAGAEPWSRFLRALQRGIRSGDMLCHPDPWSAAALLCHEGRGGALAFGDRVRGLAEEALGREASPESPWRIDVAGVTIEADVGSEVGARDLLAQAFANARPFLGAGAEIEALPLTGTDGE